MRNIKLTIEYDGTAYCGWQIQPNGRTVQAVLKKAIEKMVRHDVNLIGASRTDSGVHALGQVASFKTQSKIPLRGFLMGLNSTLPDDISIKKVEEEKLDFHARRSARSKHYRYLIYIGNSKPALLCDRVWHLRKLCDSGTASEFLKALKAAARPIKGRHDFSAFAASGDCNRSKVREIKKIEIQHVILSGAKNLIDPIHCGRSFVAKAHQDDTCGVISIDIKGTGFLKQMVRNIVGTMVGVANRSCPTDRATAMKYILNSRDRKKAHVTAPAAGLYLVEVKY